VPESRPVPRITVLAGTNGAGKSSIGGAMVRHAGGEYFNPDEAARLVRERDPEKSQTEANSFAWREGKRLLERAIAERKSFTFETTLGGDTMVGLLERAAGAGFEVQVWYVGLDAVERHIARVRARVARGGHDIPEADIRRRYKRSLQNLVRLLPKLTVLRMLDNSESGDPEAGKSPRPRLLLHLERGRIVAPSRARLARTPGWAKPVLAAALKLEASRQT
jgi:predicted ABC-type ATPase